MTLKETKNSIVTHGPELVTEMDAVSKHQEEHRYPENKIEIRFDHAPKQSELERIYDVAHSALRASGMSGVMNLTASGPARSFHINRVFGRDMAGRRIDD